MACPDLHLENTDSSQCAEASKVYFALLFLLFLEQFIGPIAKHPPLSEFIGVVVYFQCPRSTQRCRSVGLLKCFLIPNSDSDPLSLVRELQAGWDTRCNPCNPPC